MLPSGVRQIVLVGFMGSGKSTVGQALASRLGWTFHDLDAHIEALDGRDIPTIFRASGETRFRALEAEAAAGILGAEHTVLATGGGWAAEEGRLEGLPEGVVSVWLEVSADEAVRRARAEPGARPLLDTPDPVGAARALLARRERHYAGADLKVDTNGRTAEHVTELVLALLERRPAHPSAAETR